MEIISEEKFHNTEIVNGIKYHYVDDELHREDGPAIESEDGAYAWCRDGKYHREDGPAIKNIEGTEFWYLNGKLHRENGPAVAYSNGNKFWFRDGFHHREDGPAAEYSNGTKEYWYQDKLLNCSSDEELKSLLKLKLLW